MAEKSNLVEEPGAKYTDDREEDKEKDKEKEKEGHVAPPVTEEREDFAPALVLSCLVFWLCGALFGLVAFLLALLGKRRTEKGESARSCKIASYFISVLGVVVGLVVVVVVLVLHQRDVEQRGL